jgi:hypothetical protein
VVTTTPVSSEVKVVEVEETSVTGVIEDAAIARKTAGKFGSDLQLGEEGGGVGGGVMWL